MPTRLSGRLSGLEDRSDAELISAVRGGDTAAYGELFSRHADAARRLARHLVPGPDADDLVSEAFAKVLGVLQRGGGPDLAFRAYLLTAVRRLQVDRARAASRLHTTDDLTPFDPGVPFQDPALQRFESLTTARAFASLPERWQLVLWHTEVEGHRPADIAPLLGMSANAVSALAYRAREGLRQAYLSLHAASVRDDACQQTRAQLGGYVRGGLSRRDAARVEEHLETCRPCASIAAELAEVNADLRAVLAPLLLGGAAAAYLGAGAGAGAAALAGSTAASAASAPVTLLGRARDLVVTHAPTAAVAGAAASAVVAGLAIAGHQQPQDLQAERSPAASAAAPGDRTSPGGPTARRTPSAAPGAPGAARRGRLPLGAAGGAPGGAPATAPAPVPAVESTAQSAAPKPGSPAGGGAAAPSSSPQPTSGHTAGPTSGPTAAPTRPAAQPPLIGLQAQVSAGPRGVGVVVGLDLAGTPIVPTTTLGVPLPPAG